MFWAIAMRMCNSDVYVRKGMKRNSSFVVLIGTFCNVVGMLAGCSSGAPNVAAGGTYADTRAKQVDAEIHQSSLQLSSFTRQADAAVRSGNLNEAIKWMELAEKSSPRLGGRPIPSVTTKLAEFYLIAGFPEKALSKLGELPQQVDSKELTALANLQLGKISALPQNVKDETFGFIRSRFSTYKGLQSDLPATTGVDNSKGTLLMALGCERDMQANDDEARLFYLSALKLIPKNPFLNYRIASGYLAQRKIEAAAPHLELTMRYGTPELAGRAKRDYEIVLANRKQAKELGRPISKEN